MGHGEQSVEEMRELLKAVSRTFYLSMAWLPRQMRWGVSLGYLLARATDSVADTSSADTAERIRVLVAMGQAIAGDADATQLQNLSQSLSETMAEAQANPAERLLLLRFGDCLRALADMATEEAVLIRKVLSTIIEGQLWDLTFFENNNGVSTDEETKLYTYRVAGCVGEFWTELGYATMGAHYSDPAPERQELMRRAGVRFGCGLQLINILRDRQEDAARGRRYLVSDPDKWLDRAERYMNDGLDYASRLRTFRLRFATMLPALIGLRTLVLIRRYSDAPRVKIPRRAVYLCMARAALNAAFFHRA